MDRSIYTKKKMETKFSALLKPPFFHLFPLIVTVRTLSDYYSKHRCLFVSEDFRTFLNPNLSLCNEYAPPDTVFVRDVGCFAYVVVDVAYALSHGARGIRQV